MSIKGTSSRHHAKHAGSCGVRTIIMKVSSVEKASLRFEVTVNSQRVEYKKRSPKSDRQTNINLVYINMEETVILEYDYQEASDAVPETSPRKEFYRLLDMSYEECSSIKKCDRKKPMRTYSYFWLFQQKDDET